MASVQELQAKVLGTLPGKKKLKARELGVDSSYYKLLFFGEPGTGKTAAIIGLLEAGEKVFVASTDFGGHGLRTVEERLKKTSPELLKNLRYFEFSDYTEFGQFLANPDIIELEDGGKTVSIYDWNPTWLFWDGASNWQVNMADEKILSLSAGKNSTDARVEGLRMEISDYDALRRTTFRHFNDFLMLHNTKTGSLWNKAITAYEVDNTEKGGKRTPFISGSAKNFIGGGFDLVIRTVKIQKIDGSETFKYLCETTAKDAAKNRSLNVAKEEPADMKALWTKIRGGGQ